jgi:hypothetical protein
LSRSRKAEDGGSTEKRRRGEDEKGRKGEKEKLRKFANMGFGIGILSFEFDFFSTFARNHYKIKC